MTERVPESEDVLRAALYDKTRAAQGLGWTENPGTDPHMPGVTYWWVAIGDFYLGVIPDNDPVRYTWFVSQGRYGDRDRDPKTIGAGEEATPEKAREEATMCYNRNRHLPPRT